MHIWQFFWTRWPCKELAMFTRTDVLGKVIQQSTSCVRSWSHWWTGNHGSSTTPTVVIVTVSTECQCSQHHVSKHHLTYRSRFTVTQRHTTAIITRDQLPVPKDFDFGAALQCCPFAWQFAGVRYYFAPPPPCQIDRGGGIWHCVNVTPSISCWCRRLKLLVN